MWTLIVYLTVGYTNLMSVVGFSFGKGDIENKMPLLKKILKIFNVIIIITIFKLFERGFYFLIRGWLFREVMGGLSTIDFGFLYINSYFCYITVRLNSSIMLITNKFVLYFLPFTPIVTSNILPTTKYSSNTYIFLWFTNETVIRKTISSL